MKKKYEKPMVLFEDFTMSTNIAGDCDVLTSSPNEKSSCAYTDEYFDPTIGMPVEVNIFLVGNGNCTTTQVVESDTISGYQGVCYHVPTETSDLFNS